MADRLPAVKRCAIVIAVALVVVTAGCSGASPGGTTTNTTTTAAPTTQTTAETTQQTTSTTQSTSQNTTGEPRTVAASGQMAVVVDDERLDLSAVAETNQSSEFWFDTSGEGIQWQRTDANVTLADALGAVGVNVTGDGIAYQGERYTDSNNTSVAVRVNGDQVDADEYVLQQGDEVWVVAITHPLDQPVPGDHIGHDLLHVHGYINMSVMGDSVNFSQPKYKNPSHAQYFHFEGNSAPLWHAHSWSVTLQYGMNTLQGINVTEDSVTYNGTTYERSDANITIQVNGESVDPSTYVLKDGDKVTIEVSSNSSN